MAKRIARLAKREHVMAKQNDFMIHHLTDIVKRNHLSGKWKFVMAG